MSGKNNTARRVATNTVIADVKALVTPSLSYNAGDFLIMDTSSHVLAAPAAESEGATFLGVSPVTIVNGKIPSGYTTDTDDSLGISSLPGPTFGDEYLCTPKDGDSFTPGCAVYLDPATATNGVQVAGSKIVGVYTGPAVTGDGKTQIVCKLGARYPDDTLSL